MAFPKTLTELEDKIVKIWRATIDSIKRKLDITVDRVEVTEEDISTLEIEVEENTEEILATKAEVQEVRHLLALLTFELVEQGVKIESEELQQLINELNFA